MATVAALTAFNGWLTRDELGPRPKDRHGKPLGEEHGVADGLPAHDQYGNLVQEVKEGKQVKFFQGQLVDDKNPAVRKWPDLFGAPDTQRSVEQATAAPGEKR